MSSLPVADPAYHPLSYYLSRLPAHRGGGRPHPSTAIRWVIRGLPLPGGGRVFLKAHRVGARWLTNDQWWGEFVAALTAAHLPHGGDGAGPRKATDRIRASELAERELKAAGC